MQATLILERIERRLRLDIFSDAGSLKTRAQITDGELRIVASTRYTDADIERYGAARVRQWIAEDERRHRRFQRGELWYIEAQALGVVAVHIRDEPTGRICYGSMIVGGIESDASRDSLDRLTDILVEDVKAALRERGFNDLDVPTPYVLTERWVADAIS